MNEGVVEQARLVLEERQIVLIPVIRPVEPGGALQPLDGAGPPALDRAEESPLEALGRGVLLGDMDRLADQPRRLVVIRFGDTGPGLALGAGLLPMGFQEGAEGTPGPVRLGERDRPVADVQGLPEDLRIARQPGRRWRMRRPIEGGLDPRDPEERELVDLVTKPVRCSSSSCSQRWSSEFQSSLEVST